MNRHPLRPARLIAVSLARNLAHGLRGGPRRGGHRWSERGPLAEAHASAVFATLAPHLGDLNGKVGLEIGPGDHLGVCVRCLAAGAARMYALDRFAHPATAGGVSVFVGRAEEFTPPEPCDFALCNDVIEHVDDVPAVFRRVFAALKPGGVFVASVDLRGHNVFNRPDRPLDFLACPDWLYRVLFSNVVTSNRVRFGELVAAAHAAGFVVDRAEATDRADPSYLDQVRGRLLPRYRDLPDDDLGVLQALIVARKPTT